jgi:hypothetical protein
MLIKRLFFETFLVCLAHGFKEKFKESNEIFHAKRINNDITGFPEEVYFTTYYHNIAHEAWYKNYLVDIVNPASYLSKKNKTQKYVEGLGEISINDNPIIILIKLKEL